RDLGFGAHSLRLGCGEEALQGRTWVLNSLAGAATPTPSRAARPASCRALLVCDLGLEGTGRIDGPATGIRPRASRAWRRLRRSHEGGGRRCWQASAECATGAATAGTLQEMPRPLHGEGALEDPPKRGSFNERIP